MNKILFIIITILMLFFKNSSMAKYEKKFFDFNIESINGEIINLDKFQDKTILLVNVASNCGFTKQYSDLQKLYEKYQKSGLVIIAVPSNQFGNQEPGSNQEIKNFCEVNFNITFPITSKYDVKGEEAHPIYLWAKENFGNSAVPKWNFHKILINKKGEIQETYNSFTKPMSEKVIKKIEKIL